MRKVKQTTKSNKRRKVERVTVQPYKKGEGGNGREVVGDEGGRLVNQTA
jgi:hypothetical protein